MHPPIKIHMTFITELKINIKVSMKIQQKHHPPGGKAKKKAGAIWIPDFRFYYRAAMLKFSMVLAQKHR